MNTRKIGLLAALVASFVFAAAPAKAAGLVMYDIGASTPAATVVMLVTGAGVLNQVEISSGAAGDFCQFIDTSSVSGITLSMNSINGATKEIATPIVTATNTQTPLIPSIGRPFVNGLAAVCSVARKVKAWVSN